MASPPFRLDPSRTAIEIRTFVEGALARVAHSLSLSATRLEGNGTPGESPTANVRIHIDGINVRGVLKGELVDTGVLGVSDRKDIERRVREDIFRDAGFVDVHAGYTKGKADMLIRWGGESAIHVTPATVEQEADGSWRTIGRGKISLAALGIKPVYGPLRAFRVADGVEVRWDARFVLKEA